MNRSNNKSSRRERFFKAFLQPFKSNWSESIHYIVISGAIIASAFWALWTFSVFEQKNKALKELANAESELVKKKAEIKEIQGRLDGNFSSDIAIRAEVVSLEQNKYGLIIRVTVKNVGTRDVVLNLNNNPLTVYRLLHSGDRVMATKKFLPQYYEKLSTGKDERNVNFTVQKVLVGASKDINFFTEIDGEGMYYITFEASLNSEHKQRLSESNDHVWFASTYINVKN